MVSRRSFLSAAGLGTAAALTPSAARAATPAPAQLTDIEHVVILMQENRPFDHYFGTLRGVRGFDDPAAQGPTGPFYQPDPTPVRNSADAAYILPWHTDTKIANAQEQNGISHAWAAQQGAWDNGLMKGFVAAQRIAHDAGVSSNDAPLGMGYFTRDDLPFHYALADGFTICDNYYCSVFGPTNPNRIMSMSATVDPEGVMGGPCLDNSQSPGQLKWESYPEKLQQAGIDWYLYQESDNYDDNMLPFFAGFAGDPKDPYVAELNRRGNTVIPTTAKRADGSTFYGPAIAARLKSDVLGGALPQVSWIVGSADTSEHPAYRPGYGGQFLASILDALTADPAVWAKTVLFINYDENDGRFDHVTPPTAPVGTAGEYVTPAVAAANPGATDGFAGPVGLGFRVPMFVVSPFSRGGFLSSKVYDHTSTLLFLEKRFGVTVPNISDWRRSTVGDLTDAFNFAGGRDMSMPTLPSGASLEAAADRQASLPAPVMPATQVMPTQEKGAARPTPSGMVAPAPTLPEIGIPALLPLAGAAALAAGIAWRNRTTTLDVPVSGG